MSALVALAAAVAVVLVATTAIWFLRRRYLVVTVRGSSMLPSYRDGERLLVRRRRPGEELRVGQVVVATPPGSPRAPRPTEPHEAGAVSGRTPASGRNVVVRSGGQTHARRAAGKSRQRVVKRIAAVPGDPVPPGIGPGVDQDESEIPVATASGRVPPGRLVLLGDNTAESVDSRHYGYVAVDQVVGIVLRSLRNG